MSKELQESAGGRTIRQSVAIAMIVARAENGVIGRAGKLPWHISADVQHIKKLTVGKPVVMGRKTLESIGRPLPRRTNIVAPEIGIGWQKACSEPRISSRHWLWRMTMPKAPVPTKS